ncbi:hypothetical protein D9M71_623210 [compost metagenome]
MELQHAADHAGFAKTFGQGERDIGSDIAGWRHTFESDADDLWNPHHQGFAQHCSFSLDTTNTPAQHTDAVDHGGVAVSAD